MECKYTCFDRVMHMIKPCEDEEILKDLVYLIQDQGLASLLDYCVEKKLLSQSWADTIYDGIIMWEDLEGNYYEEDYDKLMLLHEKLGVTEEVFKKYMEQ